MQILQIAARNTFEQNSKDIILKKIGLILLLCESTELIKPKSHIGLLITRFYSFFTHLLDVRNHANNN